MGIIFEGSAPGIFAEESVESGSLSMPARHFHDSLELYFLLEGERYYFIEQDTWHVCPQTAVLINRGQIHKTSSVSGCARYHRFLLQLDADVLDSAFVPAALPGLHTLGDTCWGAAGFSDSEWQDILFLISLLKKELSMRALSRTAARGNAAPKEDLSSALSALPALQLLLHFVRCRRNMAESFSAERNTGLQVHTGTHQRVHDIALYLQNHYSEPCSLDELAGIFYISVPYLTRIFKSVTGFTVKEYHTMCRIRRACLLLEEGELQITEIAARTGFGNLTYFERVFKKLTDTTPLHYRRKSVSKPL